MLGVPGEWGAPTGAHDVGTDGHAPRNTFPAREAEPGGEDCAESQGGEGCGDLRPGPQRTALENGLIGDPLPGANLRVVVTTQRVVPVWPVVHAPRTPGMRGGAENHGREGGRGLHHPPPDTLWCLLPSPQGPEGEGRAAQLGFPSGRAQKVGGGVRFLQEAGGSHLQGLMLASRGRRGGASVRARTLACLCARVLTCACATHAPPPPPRLKGGRGHSLAGWGRVGGTAGGRCGRSAPTYTRWESRGAAAGRSRRARTACGSSSCTCRSRGPWCCVHTHTAGCPRARSTGWRAGCTCTWGDTEGQRGQCTSGAGGQGPGERRARPGG